MDTPSLCPPSLFFNGSSPGSAQLCPLQAVLSPKTRDRSVPLWRQHPAPHWAHHRHSVNAASRLWVEWVTRGTYSRIGARWPPVMWRETPQFLKVPSTPSQGGSRPHDDSASQGRASSKAWSFCAPASALVEGQPDTRDGPAQILGSRGLLWGCADENPHMAARKGPVRVLTCSASCCPGPLFLASGALPVKGKQW